jgi:hypothetical protein
VRVRYVVKEEVDQRYRKQHEDIGGWTGKVQIWWRHVLFGCSGLTLLAHPRFITTSAAEKSRKK